MNRMIIVLMALAFVSSGCSKMEVFKQTDNPSVRGDPDPVIEDPGPIVVGTGTKVDGVGAMTVPSGDAVIARIRNGMGGKVSPGLGNFAASLAILKKNLPKSTDPLKATGYDQVQLLVYAACTDLTLGAAPAMKSVYGVDPAQAASTQKTALIAAGQKMMDQYVAGLASTGSLAAQVSSTFMTLINTGIGNGDSATINFVSVCIAANTAGSTLMSF